MVSFFERKISFSEITAVKGNIVTVSVKTASMQTFANSGINLFLLHKLNQKY